MTDKTKEIINCAIQIHGNKYDYSKVEYINSRTKIKIICKKHGEFEQLHSKHLSGQGCGKCSGHFKKTKTDFINDAIQIHGNEYDYSKVDYYKSQEKVIIICKKHGEFEQKPNNHLSGQGCAKCYGNLKKTNIDFINHAIQIHSNKYDYSKVEYNNSHKKIIIICKKHGEFEQQPYQHLQGSGCKKCGIENSADSRRSNIDEFVQKANTIHGSKYDYSKVNYDKAHENVIIICNLHGEFEQTPSVHLAGHGCRKCGLENSADSLRSNINEFIQKANTIHNNKYDYSKSNYINSDDKIIIICSEHGEFEQSPSQHIQGQGCRICANIINGINNRSNTYEFVQKANTIHGSKYDYSKVNYNKAHDKVIIICKLHGEFEQSAYSHLNGRGCKKCGLENSADSRKYNNSLFIEKSQIVHKTKYDYSKVEYNNSLKKVIIICKKHGEFEQQPSHHLQGSGCPNCSNNYSKTQIQWLNFISLKDNIFIQHAENKKEFNIPNTKFKADGYCIETNTIYEFHGDYWHGNPKFYSSDQINERTQCTFGELYQKTLKREHQLKDFGFDLIVIWESDWINLNKCIQILQRKYRIKHIK